MIAQIEAATTRLAMLLDDLVLGLSDRLDRLGETDPGRPAIAARRRRLLRYVRELMPLAKYFAAEEAIRVTRTGMQVFGVVDLSGTDTPRLARQPVYLVALARFLAEQYQQASDRHHIQVETPAPLVVGHGDRTRGERVVSNLLSNAVKYSPDGGDVLVSVWDEPDRREHRHWAVLRVHDRGMGIPAGDLPHVFERFHRAVNVSGHLRGTGLGLAGARDMVEQHKGELYVQCKAALADRLRKLLLRQGHARTGQAQHAGLPALAGHRAVALRHPANKRGRAACSLSDCLSVATR